MTVPAEELVDAVLEVVRAFRDGRQLTPAVAALTNVWEKHPRALFTAPPGEIKNARDAQLALREALRLLCLAHYAAVEQAGLNAVQAAGAVAEECMHMSAHFVANGSTWTADQFTAECRKIFEFHKKNAQQIKAASLN
jgi:hypothetical protein